MAVTNSPNMSLPIPGVGTEAGPDYATDINAALNILDQHNHSAGSGVQINPAGININSSLSFNNQLATNLGGLSLTAQVATPVVGTVYRSGNDLYFNNGIGTNIQITNSTGVAGSPGSIANLTSPASVSYVSANQTYVFQSGIGIAGNLDAGAVTLRNVSPNSTYGVTVSPPAALSSNYGLTLPTIPASQKIMTLDNSGNMSAPYSVDGSTIVITSNIIGVKPLGITNAQLATNSVNGTNIVAGSITDASIAPNANISATKLNPPLITASSNIGNIVFTNTSFNAVLNTTVVGQGRAVLLYFTCLQGTVNTGTFATDPGGVLYLRVMNLTSNTVLYTGIINAANNGGSSDLIKLPPGVANCVDFTNPLGTQTYSLQVATNGAQGFINNVQMIAVSL